MSISFQIQLVKVKFMFLIFVKLLRHALVDLDPQILRCSPTKTMDVEMQANKHLYKS